VLNSSLDSRVSCCLPAWRLLPLPAVSWWTGKQLMAAPWRGRKKRPRQAACLSNLSASISCLPLPHYHFRLPHTSLLSLSSALPLSVTGLGERGRAGGRGAAFSLAPARQDAHAHARACAHACLTHCRYALGWGGPVPVTYALMAVLLYTSLRWQPALPAPAACSSPAYLRARACYNRSACTLTPLLPTQLRLCRACAIWRSLHRATPLTAHSSTASTTGYCLLFSLLPPPLPPPPHALPAPALPKFRGHAAPPRCPHLHLSRLYTPRRQGLSPPLLAWEGQFIRTMLLPVLFSASCNHLSLLSAALCHSPYLLPAILPLISPSSLPSAASALPHGRRRGCALTAYSP